MKSFVCLFTFVLAVSICGAGTLYAQPGGARGSIIEDRAARKLLEAGDTRYEADEKKKAVEVWQSVIERYPRSRVRFDAHMRLGDYLLEQEPSRPDMERLVRADLRGELTAPACGAP